MPADAVSELEERVRLLETELGSRRHRARRSALVVLVAVAGLGAAAAQDAPVPGVVEAGQFVIRNDEGQVVFHVRPEGGGAVLVLRDDAGRVTARLPPTTEIIPLTR